MKLLASILMITLLVTVAQPTAAQDASKKAEIQNMALLTGLLGIINKLMIAGDVIKKNCPDEQFLKFKFESLNKAAEATKLINICKRQLKQKGVNTIDTKAIFLIIEKYIAFQDSPDRLTEEDMLVLTQVFGFKLYILKQLYR